MDLVDKFWTNIRQGRSRDVNRTYIGQILDIRQSLDKLQSLSSICRDQHWKRAPIVFVCCVRGAFAWQQWPRRGPVALFLSNAPLAPYFSIWQRGRLRVKYRDRCLVINMLFLARGISLSFLLPAPLEATASLPNLASCPEFWGCIYRARITMFVLHTSFCSV